jgi:WASH complex subunit strumpellin
VNIKEEILIIISLAADMSYAWQVINDYVDLMQGRIKRYPLLFNLLIGRDAWSVLKLRATFVKLSSILHLPLVRINQAASPDLFSVSEYFSGTMVCNT